MAIPAEKKGLAPGALVHVGKRAPSATRIHLYRYNAASVEVVPITHLRDLEDQLQALSDDQRHWLHISGLEDVAVFQWMVSGLGIHPLVMEDVLNTHQRPKIDDFDDMVFSVLRHVFHDEDTESFDDEQVSLILKDNLVISIHERNNHLFEPVINRLKAGKGRLRHQNVDYLFYALMDLIIDGYFEVNDRIEEAIYDLEEVLLGEQPGPDTLKSIQHLKRSTLTMRKNISPVRDMIQALVRDEHPLIRENIYPFFRDVEDHAIRVTESLDNARELLASMLDIYLSTASNQMNETMKVLTVFASIFIPLTFIAGVYGMNFEQMPELRWEYGYLAVWVVFVLTGVGLVFFFRKKGWL